MQRSVPVTLEGLAIRLRGKMVVLGFALSRGRCGKLTICFMVRAWGQLTGCSTGAFHHESIRCRVRVQVTQSPVHSIHFQTTI